jgi:hypothetical protein
LQGTFPRSAPCASTPWWLCAMSDVHGEIVPLLSEEKRR